MCWYCGSPITDAEPIGRSFRCPACGKDLRVCKHCAFFLPKSNECAESGAEKASDTERANFCEWFKLDPKFRAPTSGAEKAVHAEKAAHAAFDSLFS
ncbi:MAG: hypothetical protein LBP19_06430 [Treponema sp.]|jgi:predicted RNA-binding Zn-ribbon protein involved in translation (DUF1610 family)|nr:hypothetical protein [Treponema sp.]